MESCRTTLKEKELLLRLVAERKEILECRKANPESNSLKEKTWKEIEMLFNNHEDVNKRTWRQIRRYWENTKANRKRELVHVKRQKLDRSIADYILPDVDTAPRIKMFSNIHHTHSINDDCDSEDVEEDPIEIKVEVDDEIPSTSGRLWTSEESNVEKEAEAQFEMDSNDSENELHLSKMRRELLMMDKKVKTNEIAASAAKLEAAEAEKEAAELMVEVARNRLAAAQVEVANAEAIGRYQQEMFELKKEALRMRLEHPNPF